MYEMYLAVEEYFYKGYSYSLQNVLNNLQTLHASDHYIRCIYILPFYERLMNALRLEDIFQVRGTPLEGLAYVHRAF